MLERFIHIDLLNSDLYKYASIILIIGLLILSIYNRIKFLCLKVATEKVAAVEKLSELTGEEKFALVITWINSELPLVFRNALFQSIIEKLVQFAYDNCFNYMKNYIKRKTGYDISTLINQDQDTKSKSDNNT